MNFAQVQAANGQNVNILATITEIVGEGINAKSGKPYKKVKMRDTANVMHNVTLRGEALPTVQQINQLLSFSISSFQGVHNNTPYTGYSGFWNSAANTNPTAPYVPPAQPMPQQPMFNPPTQNQPKPSNGNGEFTTKDWCICRQSNLKAAASRIDVPVGEVERIAEEWTQYAMTGKRTPLELPQREAGEDDPNDNPPF